jgi:hypothetical protein
VDAVSTVSSSTCRLPALTVLLAGSPDIVLCSVRRDVVVAVSVPRPAVPRSLPLPLAGCALVVVSSSRIVVTRSAVVRLQSRGWRRLLVIRVGRIDEARIKVARLLRASRTGRRPPLHLGTAANLLPPSQFSDAVVRIESKFGDPSHLSSSLGRSNSPSERTGGAGMSSIRQRTTRRSAAAAAESPADSDASPARRRSADKAKSASGSTRDSPTKQRLPLTERRKGSKGGPAADLTYVASFRRCDRPPKHKLTLRHDVAASPSTKKPAASRSMLRRRPSTSST